MGIKDTLATTRTARRVEATIEPVGKVLFVEPAIADLDATQKRYLKYALSTVGKVSTVTVDVTKSNIPANNRALVALTCREPDTGELVFTGERDVADTLSALGEEGTPLHGAELLQKLVDHANAVCGLGEGADKEDHEEN